MEPKSKEIAATTTVTAIETTADRTGDSELAYLAPAAAAALRLLAESLKRRGADQDAVILALKDAKVHEAFADVLDAASTVIMEDPYEFDGRLHADNLSAVAGEVRDVFRRL
ncbi:hypothetical protein ACWCXB_00170 [Streptomyces sp. NPDC001514]